MLEQARVKTSYGAFLKSVNAGQPEPSEAGRLLLGLLAERGPLTFQELRRGSRVEFLELAESLLCLCRRELVAADAASELRFALTGTGRALLGVRR